MTHYPPASQVLAELKFNLGFADTADQCDAYAERAYRNTDDPATNTAILRLKDERLRQLKRKRGKT